MLGDQVTDGKRMQVVSKSRSGDMVTTHYYHPRMPIGDRVSLLSNLVRKGAEDAEIRDLALAIRNKGTRNVTVRGNRFSVQGAGCKDRDAKCEARAIYDWVKNNIAYTGDIGPVRIGKGRKSRVEGIDVFQAAGRTVQFRGGDCDDHTILVRSLLAHNGFPQTSRVTTPSRLQDWQHVYAVVGLDKSLPIDDRHQKTYGMDTTVPGDFFFQEARYADKKDFV